ncbi:MAG: tyrosine-type recombinase/integrase [Pseudonocardiales bacterium]
MTARRKLGSVESLVSGRYRARLTHPVTGDRIVVRPADGSESFTSKTAARAAIAVEDRRLREELRAPRRVGRVDLAEFAERWAESAGGTAATRANRRASARQIGRAFPGVAVGELTRSMVREWLTGLETAGRASSSIGVWFTALRLVMAEAIETELRDSDPTVGLKPPRVVKRAQRFITDDELTAIVAHMPEWARAAVYLSRYAGLRIGEVCGLQAWALKEVPGSVVVSHVVQCDGTVRSWPKGRAVHTVPLGLAAPYLAGHLTAHSVVGEGHVFRAPGKRPLVTPARLRAEWSRALKAAGITVRRPRWHDLRHTFGAALKSADVPTHVIRDLLRHAGLGATDIYTPITSAADLAKWVVKAS